MALREVRRCSQQWPSADMAKIRGEICESGQQKPLTQLLPPHFIERKPRYMEITSPAQGHKVGQW